MNIIQPLSDRVLIKPIKEEEKSGIILAESKEMPQKGEVIALGSDATTVNAGDTIVFGKYAGDRVEVNDEEFIILPIDSILAIIK